VAVVAGSISHRGYSSRYRVTQRRRRVYLRLEQTSIIVVAAVFTIIITVVELLVGCGGLVLTDTLILNACVINRAIK